VTSRWEDIDPRAEKRPARRYYRLTAGGAVQASAALEGARRPEGTALRRLAGGLAAIAAIAVAGLAGPGGRGRGSGLRGRGRDDDGPAGAAAHRWRMLVMVSRLMPRPAGCRWLAEAESVLAEIAAARRGAAIRSYLLSAPRLVVMMWAREVLRRARPGPRHPR
jgi:hypothetical protein